MNKLPRKLASRSRLSVAFSRDKLHIAYCVVMLNLMFFRARHMLVIVGRAIGSNYA